MTEPRYPHWIDVGELLKVKRVQAGVSARDLSVKIGKSPSYVNKVESGTIDPSLQAFARLAVELKLNHHEIAVCLGVEA